VPQPDKWTDDGWFRTGDVVTIDSERYVKITDRLKDLIKSGGEWISSVDLENALVGHAAIRQAAVIAVPHPKWQERPLALVVLNVDPCELRSFLQQNFAPWQVPDAFVVCRGASTLWQTVRADTKDQGVRTHIRLRVRHIQLAINARSASMARDVLNKRVSGAYL